MSNCIHLITYKMTFSASEVDVENLLEQVYKHQNHKSNGTTCGSEHSDEAFICRTCYWFLTPKNVCVGGPSLIINVGEGRSTHTFRDFKGTMVLLNRFIKVGLHFTFRCTEEGDGFRHPFDMDVHFKPGGKCWVGGEEVSYQ